MVTFYVIVAIPECINYLHIMQLVYRIILGSDISKGIFDEQLQQRRVATSYVH
jgi:hypothetical protein